MRLISLTCFIQFFCFFVASLLGEYSYAAGLFDWKTKEFNAYQNSRIADFLQTAENTLPRRVREFPSRSIHIRFVKMGSDPLPSDPCASRAKIRIGAIPNLQRHKIYLNANLLPVIWNGPSPSPTFRCSHQSYYRMALAGLLHEMAHLYDLRQRTSIWKGDISGSEPFLSLTGWFRKALEPWSHSYEVNQEVSRALEVKEYQNPAESFAVNFEYFLLDPQYQCRKPVLYHYYSSLLSHVPFPGMSCSPFTKVFLNMPSLGAKELEQADLDPRRLYQVHYLMASPGKKPQSRLGHAMLRLVYCDPRRAEIGPQCLADVSSHVVLSYRANVRDVHAQGWNPLHKRYPSKLYLIPMKEIVEEYTKESLRDLISVPMALDSGEKEDLVYSALDHFWGYRGTYGVLRNNCSTEIFRLLQKAVKDFDQHWIHSACPSSPGNLLRFLASHRLTQGVPQIIDRDGTVLNEGLARSRGYVFRSNWPQIQDAYDSAKLQVPEFNQMELNAYLTQTSAANRLELFQRNLDQSALQAAEKKKLAAQFFLLEAQALRLLRKDLQDRTMKWADNHENSELSQKIWRRHGDPMANYLNQVIEGYGIPLREEAQAISTTVNQLQRRLGEDEHDAVYAIYDQEFGPQFKELTMLGRNVDYLRVKMFRRSSPTQH